MIGAYLIHRLGPSSTKHNGEYYSKVEDYRLAWNDSDSW